MQSSLFLQSKEWEEFQKSIGRKTWRAGGTLLIKHDLPLGFNYLYSPRPVIGSEEKFLAEAEKIAKVEKAVFLKIDPTEKLQITNYPPSLKLRRAGKLQIHETTAIQPGKTIIINLQKSEDELLRGMRDKTRYNIRLAERRGVNAGIVASAVEIQFEKFWSLLEETARRDRFHLHPKDYYKKLLAVKSEDFLNEMFFAEYGGEILAAAIVNFYKGAATYLHGASANANRELMASHLTHWQIIREAKKRGCSYYDLWGIDEKKWPGLTRFKLGFGGNVIEFPPSFDVVYKPLKYSLYKLVKFSRNLCSGYIY